MSRALRENPHISTGAKIAIMFCEAGQGENFTSSMVKKIRIELFLHIPLKFFWSIGDQASA